MQTDLKAQERSVRTLLVSDVHLGCRFAQAEHFLAYLNRIRPDRLFILGDFLDGWEFRAKWRWSGVYTGILNRLFDLANRGTELFYTPGNHDAFLRCPEILRLVRRSGVVVNVEDEFIFDTEDGRRFLVLHGDKFDVIETHYQWASVLLTYLYAPFLSMNWTANRLLGRKSSPYAMCAVMKDRVKAAVRFFSHFEEKLFDYVRERNCDGAVCGHIHAPRISNSSFATYINTGDWVENCTGLVEHHNGELVLESFFPSGLPQTVAPPDPLERIKEPVAPGEYARCSLGRL